MDHPRVLYEELCPAEFLERVRAVPVAYLPLGTLEWHGPHLPLGADGIQAQELFCRVAQRVGGVVLPKLFLGPDRFYRDPARELYGMDICTGDSLIPYPLQQLPGSAYWMPDEDFDAMVLRIARNLRRAGFRFLAAHGHGPSIRRFAALKERMQAELGLACVTAFDFVQDERLRYQNDHAAANETSIVMAVRPDLARMDQLTCEGDQVAMAGRSPLAHASPEYGCEILAANVEALADGLTALLAAQD